MRLGDSLRPWQSRPGEIAVLRSYYERGTPKDGMASMADMYRVRDRIRDGGGEAQVRIGLGSSPHSWLKEGVWEGARTVYTRRTFTEDDLKYAVNIPRLVDVAVQKFEDQRVDPYTLRAEMREHFEQLPSQQERRKGDAASGEYHGEFFAALADLTLVNGLLTSVMYRNVADTIAAQLESGGRLVPSEDQVRRYLGGEKRTLERHTPLEPQLWQHLEAVSYWISKTQHQFWELAFSGRPEGDLNRDLIEMKQKASKNSKPYVAYMIRLKEDPPDFSEDNIVYYQDSLTCDSPDTILAIGGPVQNSFRALVYEYLRYPQQEGSDPLQTAFNLFHYAPNWAEVKHRKVDDAFGPVSFGEVLGAVIPPDETLSTDEFVSLLYPTAGDKLENRGTKYLAAGRCPAARGRQRATEPDALFQFIEKKYGHELVPPTIRPTERLTALQLLVATETGVFDEIEKARAKLSTLRGE